MYRYICFRLWKIDLLSMNYLLHGDFLRKLMDVITEVWILRGFTMLYFYICMIIYVFNTIRILFYYVPMYKDLIVIEKPFLSLLFSYLFIVWFFAPILNIPSLPCLLLSCYILVIDYSFLLLYFKLVIFLSGLLPD